MYKNLSKAMFLMLVLGNAECGNRSNDSRAMRSGVSNLNITCVAVAQDKSTFEFGFSGKYKSIEFVSLDGSKRVEVKKGDTRVHLPTGYEWRVLVKGENGTSECTQSILSLPTKSISIKTNSGRVRVTEPKVGFDYRIKVGEGEWTKGTSMMLPNNGTIFVKVSKEGTPAAFVKEFSSSGQVVTLSDYKKLLKDVVEGKNISDVSDDELKDFADFAKAQVSGNLKALSDTSSKEYKGLWSTVVDLLKDIEDLKDDSSMKKGLKDTLGSIVANASKNLKAVAGKKSPNDTMAADIFANLILEENAQKQLILEEMFGRQKGKLVKTFKKDRLGSLSRFMGRVLSGKVSVKLSESAKKSASGLEHKEVSLFRERSKTIAQDALSKDLSNEKKKTRYQYLLTAYNQICHEENFGEYSLPVKGYNGELEIENLVTLEPNKNIVLANASSRAFNFVDGSENVKNISAGIKKTLKIAKLAIKKIKKDPMESLQLMAESLKELGLVGIEVADLVDNVWETGEEKVTEFVEFCKRIKDNFEFNLEGVYTLLAELNRLGLAPEVKLDLDLDKLDENAKKEIVTIELTKEDILSNIMTHYQNSKLDLRDSSVSENSKEAYELALTVMDLRNEIVRISEGVYGKIKLENSEEFKKVIDLAKKMKNNYKKGTLGMTVSSSKALVSLAKEAEEMMQALKIYLTTENEELYASVKEEIYKERLPKKEVDL